MLFWLTDLFHELDTYNQDGEYIRYRHKNLRKILTIATICVVCFVMSFHLIDGILPDANPELLLWVRVFACLVFLINLGLVWATKSPAVIRFHVYTGVLLCAAYTTVQTILTGGFQSPYWHAISLVIIVWFVFIPMGYRMQILTGLIMMVQYVIIVYFMDSEITSVTWLAFQLCLVLGNFVIGVLAAIHNNHSSARVYFNQNALEYSESKYRNLVELATDGIIIIRNEKFLFTNRTFQEMTGYTAEELQAMTIFDLVIPEDHETIRKVHQRRMNGDRFNTIYSITGITKSGRLWSMELNSSTIDYNGLPSAFIIVRDFSERVTAQKALIESEERYRTVFNMVGDAILLMRYETGEIVDVNDAACKLYGYTREEFLNLSNPDVSAEPELSMKILRENKGYVYIPNRQHKRKDGSILNVEIIGNVFRVNNEELAISVIHDYTEKKKLEQELEKSYSVLEENYSHTLEQMQTYFAELQAKKSELLRVQKENLQSQFDTLKNQVNPHFLFNSLNILSSLISVNPELAEEFTGNLSKIYRYILEHKSDDLATLASELDFLHAYSFLLNIRFESKLKFNINLGKEYLKYKIPPLALQILIENAIKHNAFSVRSPLIIDIFIDESKYLHIENNYQRRENNIESTRVGLANIASRYSFFTDRETSFGLEGDRFIAKIPLL